ncbi:MAG: hypothetical protein NC078_05065 [Ruminococcus sp.]|nr:hypothetical protein [Ruminococcus sp.]
MTTVRTYDELCRLGSFEERFGYLKLDGVVGEESFGNERYLNQRFYRSPEWKRLRDKVLLRDNGCDLGIAGREIFGRIYIHHMNPISAEDIVKRSEILLSERYLICVSFETHNAIHFGNEDILREQAAERMPGDTCPWKRR